MIKLEMNHNLFGVIQEEISSTYTNKMSGGSIEDKPILRKEYFNRILKDTTISFVEEEKDCDYFKYTINISEEDFIILYNEVLWGWYEGYGAIKYDFYRNRVKQLVVYLSKVKTKYNLQSTLDDVKKLKWYLD